MTSINTRADLDALAGTPEHAAFMSALAGTLYRFEKDDSTKTWKVVQDVNGIERFGFALDDFANVAAPAPPLYVAPETVVPDSVEMVQARLALLGVGVTALAVEAVMSKMPEPDRSVARIEWEFRPRVRRNSALVLAVSAALNLTPAQVDDLFVAAAKL